MKQFSWLSALLMGAVLSACAPAPQPNGPNPPTANKPSGNVMMCTEEAKLCPDGKTYVSRNGAKGCAFDDCPTHAPVTNTPDPHILPPPNAVGGGNGNMAVCTMEAKLCPDGKTYVSRNSAKGCAFDACPGN